MTREEYLEEHELRLDLYLEKHQAAIAAGYSGDEALDRASKHAAIVSALRALDRIKDQSHD